MDTQGTIGIKATLDISEMQKNVQKYVQNIDMMQDHTDTASQSVARSFSRMQAAGMAFLSIDMAKRLATEMVSVYGTFQQLDIAFKTMLQSGDKAKKLMGELTNFAAVTPFNLVDVGKGAKQLLAYGTKVESIKTELEMLGNVASGVSVPLGDLIYLYGTLRSQGRAYTVDIRQFAGRGIPIYEELAKVLNVNVGEVNGLVEAGKVGFPQVERAFQNMTNQGGMFFNLMQEQSKSVTGQISNLRDKIDMMFNELGQSNDEFINMGIDGVSLLVEHYKEVGTTLGVLVTMYGIHKTALIANASYYGALHKAENVVRINAETEALKQLCAEEKIAVAIKSDLKEGSENFLEALKEEINIEKEKQSQLVAKSGLELDAAKSRLDAAETVKEKALQEIQLRKEELAAAMSTAQVEKNASIEKEMLLEREKQSRSALLAKKLEERKITEIGAIEEMKYQQWLQASSGKDTAAIDAKIAAKQKEIAVTSEKIAIAKAEEIQHAQNIVALRAEQKSIDGTIESKNIDKIQTKLNTAEQNLNSASKNANAAANDISAQQTIFDSASKKVNTLETGLNTAGVSSNTAAKSFGARVTGLLTAATVKLNAVMAANLWTIVAIGIAAVIYGLYKLITYQTDAEKAQEKLNDRVKEFNSETAAEQAEIERLFGKLEKAKEGTEDYKEAKDAIIDKYGEYLKGLGDEIEKLRDVEAAYQAVSAAAKQAALDRAIADSTSTAQKDWADKQTGLLDDLDKAIRESEKFEKNKGKKGIDREVSAIVQLIKNDLKSSGKLSAESQSMVNSLTKEYYVPSGAGAGSYQTRNDVQVYVTRMMKNNEILEKTYKDIHDKLGNDTNQYINLTAKQISNDIAMFEAALDRFKNTGKNQVVKTHDGSISNMMGEYEITNHLNKLKEAQSRQKKEEEKTAKSKIAPDIIKEVKAATDEVEKLKQEIEDLRNGKGKVDAGKTIKSVIEEKEKSLKEAEAALATLTGDDKKTIKSRQQKQEEANKLKVEQAEIQRQIDEQNQQIKAKAVQAELELSQAKIDTLDEGFKKEQQQLDLNYRKAKVENERRANEYIKDQQETERKEWEKQHPKYKEEGLVFAPKTQTKEDLSPDKKKTLESYDQATEDAKNASEKRLAKSLLETYQDYTDQRLAIEKKFNDDIEALRVQREKYAKEGDTGKVQQTDRSIAQATKSKGESLVNFDYEQLKKSPDYVRAFENLEETSSETLNSLLSQLENAKQTAAQVLSPDQLREYTNTIQSIMDELDERNPFQALADRKQELAEAEEELAKAQQQLDAVQGGAKIQTGVKNVKYNQESGKIESEKTYLSASEAAEKYSKAQNKVVKKSAQVKTAEKKVTDVISELSQSISEVGNSVGGLTGEIISMIGGIGTTVMGAMQGLSSVSKTASTAIQTVEKASVILAIIGAAVQIATKIFDMFGGDDTTEKYEDAKEAYESYINILDRVIEKQLELAESLSGDNANAAYEKAIEAIKEQSRNAKVLGKQYLNSGASGKSHSKGYNEVDDMSWEGWNQAAQALGMTIDQFKDKMGGRMAGLFDLTDEQLAALQSDAGIFWSQLDSDTQNYADQIANGVAKVAEVIEQRMTDVTLIDMDSLRSDFQDLLADMDSGSADFADNFEEYMKNAIINSMLKESYMGRLEAWRKKFYAAMDGGMTDEEYKDLKEEGTQISDDMRADQEKMAEMYGWTGDESSTQDSTKGGFQTMSQDTGDELNGRFTALQMAGEEIKLQSIIQTSLQTNIAVNVEAIKSSTLLTGTVMSELRDLSLIANDHLEQISKNTKFLSSMNDRLVNIENNTKGLIHK